LCRASVLAAVAAFVLSVCASAQALTTIGEVAPPNPPANCTNGPADVIQLGVASGPVYTVSSPGTITSWSTSAAAGAGQTLKFKVYRPVSGLTYEVVGHDGPRPLVPSIVNTFPVNIPVKAGDVIGINDQNAVVAANACIFTASLGDTISALTGDVDSGPITFPITAPGAKVNVSATLQTDPPVVSSVTPARGSVKGGTAVTITGANFTQITGVSFGGVAAPSFAPSGNSSILAVVPAAKKPGAVDVTVTGAAGTSLPSSVAKFTYKACVVPKLKGKSLKADRKKLKKAGCKLGNVGGRKGKDAKVTKQNPKPGKVLAPGATVNVKLG
jgi:IPT/TIG domain/PASTA domain